LRDQRRQPDGIAAQPTIGNFDVLIHEDLPSGDFGPLRGH
jgi:hypothetical protein